MTTLTFEAVAYLSNWAAEYTDMQGLLAGDLDALSWVTIKPIATGVPKESIKIGTATITLTIASKGEVTAGAVAALNAEIAEVRDTAAKSVNRLEDMKKQLLCIEYTPADEAKP